MPAIYRRSDPIAYVPPQVERRATALGYVIKVEVIPGKDFATRLFELMGTGNEPDVISIDNHGHLEGITTAFGKFAGIWTNDRVRKSLVQVEEVLGDFAKGWQFLLRGSPNHDKARALVEDLVDCDDVQLDGNSADIPELRRVNELAVASHVECRAADAGISDPDRFPTSCGNNNVPPRIKVIKTCALSGNSRLAFASSVVGIESHDRVGRRTIAAVLRKTDKWRALTVAGDPVTAKEFASDALPFARRLAKETPQTPDGQPAVILTPDGTYPAPKAGDRFGSFSWKGSPSAGVQGEIVEFNYGQDVRLVLLPGAAPDQDREISAGRLWTTKSPWVWRVWSIRSDGGVTFSDVRQFRH